jgi:peptidyl-prolyl cis-trans isomerase B (cyclophilin B)
MLVDEKSYTFAYSNTLNNFDNQLSNFQNTIDSFKILSQDNTIMKSSTDNSSEEGGGCLIATAAYGSELAPQVQMLREIRDNQLMNTESGSAFMGTFNELYYTFSPYIADMERESPVFKEIVKAGLTPMLSTLAIMENAESESEVISLGLSVIALNLGMYLGIPAIVIIGIKSRK